MSAPALPMPLPGEATPPAGAAPLLARPAALPIGALLMEMGRLTAEDAQRILQHQAQTGQLYGEAGIELGLLRIDDVRAALAIQFGQLRLPRDAALAWELVAAWHPDSEAVERLRSLRSELMLRWFENDARHAALAIVSPGGGEGRTWITANLGTLFAQLGLRTLVVDADLRRPRLHRIFGRPGRIGLSAILAGRAGPPESIVAIEAIPDLFLLPAGITPPNPQELLARDPLQRLLSSLRPSYDVVLVDTPPFGSCADAGTIAARAGAALVVACRDASAMPGLAALTHALREFGVTLVGAVLNAQRRP